MDFISGSTDSLISLGMAMSQARVRDQFAVASFKKGLEAEAQAAMSLIASARVVSPPNTSQTGQLIDVVA